MTRGLWAAFLRALAPKVAFFAAFTATVVAFKVAGIL